MSELTIIILAAGDGTRMKSATPKLLHQIGGLPIIGHVIRAAQNVGADNLAIITSPNNNQLTDYISSIAREAQIFTQNERKGTAHAVLMAKKLFTRVNGNILIVYGDHPLLREENFRIIINLLEGGKDGAILGFYPPDASGYGRLVTDGDKLLNIIEHKDANEEQRKIDLCNGCILGFKAQILQQTIEKIDNNNVQNEYYLGDLVPLANQLGYNISYGIADYEDVLGVNDRAQLSIAEKIYQNRLRKKFMNLGVSLLDAATVYFSYDSEIENDVIIEPNVFIGKGVKIRNGAIIRAFSHIEGATIGKNTVVGPFARLRPGAQLADKVRIGNFVEVKQANIKSGAKINHLSYIGDANIGEEVNIGAGTITCNYDGVNKSITDIEKGAFIGSNSSLVAPITIGENSYIASGSVINENVPKDALAISRQKQVNKPQYANKLRAIAKSRKNRKAD